MALEIQQNPVNLNRFKHYPAGCFQNNFKYSNNENHLPISKFSNTLILIQCHQSSKNNHDAETLKRLTK